jgi:hypothetical protein
MNPENRRKLEARVVAAAEAALTRQEYASPVDVLLGIGWLAPAHLQEWRTGRGPCLEGAVQANLSRVSEAMRLFRSWAERRGLRPSETAYVARTPDRRVLRFSKSGDPDIERAYRTHWVSPDLSERKRRMIEERASRPPDLLVIRPLDQDWKCHRCGDTGGILMMENPGPACLRCVGLDHLVLLPSGDAALTRRAGAKSKTKAVLVRFSGARKRYERQGLLVEPGALGEAEAEIAAERCRKGRPRPGS